MRAGDGIATGVLIGLLWWNAGLPWAVFALVLLGGWSVNLVLALVKGLR